MAPIGARSVFISYSHKDESWKDRVVEQLKILELEGMLDVWVDQQIAAGDAWRPEIDAALGWHLSGRRRNDEGRARRYGECWRKAAGFVGTLILEEKDTFPFRCPDRALGGVRCTVSRADIRIDQVSHFLHALVEGHQDLL